MIATFHWVDTMTVKNSIKETYHAIKEQHIQFAD